MTEEIVKIIYIIKHAKGCLLIVRHFVYKAMQWAHFSRNIPPTKNLKKSQRRYKVCAENKKKKREKLKNY